MTNVTVLRDRFVPGGSLHGCVRAPLGEALQRAFPCDAHFAAYDAGPERLATRLTRDAIGQHGFHMAALVLDVDAPNHAPTATWRAQEAVRVGYLLQNGRTAGGFCYQTRGGYRLVWRLAEPFAITSEEDAQAWRAGYLAFCDELLREHAIQADRSCADWQRLFRLPHATRAADGKPEDLPTRGDPHAIATIELHKSSRSLVAVGAALTAIEPPQVNVANVEASPRRALFYRKLEDAGAILGTHGSDGRAFRIICPRNRLHTTGKPGNGSTMLWLPEPGASGWGAIHCFHSSCVGATAEEWLAALDTGESAQVRRVVRVEAAGIDLEVDSARVSLRVAPADGGQALPLRYVKVFSAHKKRWAALWECSGVDAPSDLEIGGDLSAACAELRGRLLVLALEGNVVRMILSARSEAA